MSFLKSIALRFWLLTVIVGMAIALPAISYYQDLQIDLISGHTEKENLDKTSMAAAVINAAIESENLDLIEELVTEVRNNGGFSFVALTESDTVFACYPQEMQQFVLNRSDSLIYSSKPIRSSLIQGEIITASSMKEDKEILNTLKKPLSSVVLLALIVSLGLFTIVIVLLSRPIRKAVELTKKLSEGNYQYRIPNTKRRDEIGTLFLSLDQLRQNLIKLETENNNFNQNLQRKVDSATERLNLKDKFTQHLLTISKLMLDLNQGINFEDQLREILISIQKEKVLIEDSFILIRKKEEYTLISAEERVNAMNQEELKTIFEILQNRKNTFINDIAIFEKISGIQDLKGFVFYPVEIDISSDTRYVILLLLRDSDIIPIEIIEFYVGVFNILLENYARQSIYKIELNSLNQQLEQKVIEKTKQNLEISNSLIAQEKLATLGEISAGVAHDLNTPLGSIKASAQSLEELTKSLTNELFTNRFSEQEAEVLKEAFRISPIPNIFLSNSERKQNLEALQARHKEVPDVASSPTEFISIAKLGLTLDHITFINKLRQLDDEPKVKVMNNLGTIFKIRIFNSFILNAEGQAEKVVNSLSKFIRADLTQKKTEINLAKSLDVLWPLFRHRLNDGTSLKINVDESITILGIEMNLFQVWTNLLKNAIDALSLDQNYEEKQIVIETEVRGDYVEIHFSNNGPKIPEEISTKIFKKFFTTKQDQNGTGLGLSLVSKIINEHQGSISLTSNEDMTTFTVTLPRIV